MNLQPRGKTALVRGLPHCIGHRNEPDCKQVVVMPVIMPEIPHAYEVINGNTSEKRTLRGFLKKIEGLYGQARRVWLMDRAIPTEAVPEMRASDQEIFYLDAILLFAQDCFRTQVCAGKGRMALLGSKLCLIPALPQTLCA